LVESNRNLDNPRLHLGERRNNRHHKDHHHKVRHKEEHRNGS
jgi:hypothetical protein